MSRAIPGERGGERAARRWPVAAVHVAALTVAALYLAQHLTAPPNASEGAVMLDYVQRTARGDRIFFDFFDYYGPFAWWPPALFYRLAGEREIGVRVWLLAVKLASVLSAWGLVRPLAGRWHARLAGALVLAVVGQPWAYFQIAYAAHVVVPETLVVWALLLAPSGRSRTARNVAAGLLTAVIVWTKASSGAFVLASGLFHLLYWLPAPAGAERSGSRPGAMAFRVIQVAGLILAACVFHLYVRPRYGVLYFVYLTAPLAIALGATLRRVLVDARAETPFAHHARAALLYGGVTVGASGAFLFAYFGRSAGRYLSALKAVFSRLHYDWPFPEVGRQGPYVGFGEYYWPQLPWLLTAAALAWLLLAGRAGRPRDGIAERKVVGLLGMCSFTAFVLYSRADESHEVQALLPAAAALPVVLRELERRLVAAARLRAVRVGVGAAWALGLTTILWWPEPGAYSFAGSDWGSPRLEYLRYHPHTVPYLSESLLGGKTYAEWDRELDAAARQVDELTEDGEPVLVLGRAQLVNFASGTVPIGEGYSHFFYLLRTGLLSREDVVAMVPPDVLDRAIHGAPRVVVAEHGDRGLLEQFPELASAFERGSYRLVGKWGTFRVFARDASR